MIGEKELIKQSIDLLADSHYGQVIVETVDQVTQWFEQEGKYDQAVEVYRQMLDSSELNENPDVAGLADEQYLSDWDFPLTHVTAVFGKCGRPFYNSVVSTFCYQLAAGEIPHVDVDGQLNLLHAQQVAQSEREESPYDHERLQTMLNAMPDVFRIALLMFYFEEKSYQEIADTLEIPLGTVMSRLSRAKSDLRKRLDRPVASAKSPS